MKKTLKTILIISLVFTAGCSAGPRSSAVVKTVTVVPQGTKGEYHIVRRGETLWSISRCYSVNLNELADFNRIDNAKSIEVGQKIFIPEKLQMQQPIANPQCRPGSIFDWPYKGYVVLGFNELKQDVLNQGIDIAARPGASVSAAAAGNIVFTSQNLRGYGKTIIISHADDYMTVYSNNEENLVKTGDFVRQGQVIAKAGSTGRASSCLVHFELRKKNKPQNPILYLP